jgi:hypothetical protein
VSDRSSPKADDDAGTRAQPSTLELLRWPTVVVVLAILLVVATYTTCRFIARGPEAVVDAAGEVGRAAADIAGRFASGTITSTFVAAIPELLPGSSRLELAAYEATETFLRSDERRIAWDLVSLGTTVTEIRVPVTYRYHLRLDEPWHLAVHGDRCVVQAPAIRPTLPPAIHTDRLEKRAERGWARFNVDDQMDALQRSITPTLTRRATDAKHLELVREQCRVQVAEFVRGWLLREQQWRSDRLTSITVVFADEDGQADSVRPPTVVLDDGALLEAAD